MRVERRPIPSARRSGTAPAQPKQYGLGAAQARGALSLERLAISRVRLNGTSVISWESLHATSCDQNRPDRARRLHGGVGPHFL